MRLSIDLQLPADARFLPKTRQAIRTYLDDLIPERDVVHDVILALDEACANVIRHAFPGQTEATYRIQADLDAENIEISVSDEGIGLDPKRLATASASDDLGAMSGRGLGIIRDVMSEVTVEPAGPDGGTRLCMRRRIAAPVLS